MPSAERTPDGAWPTPGRLQATANPPAGVTLSGPSAPAPAALAGAARPGRRQRWYLAALAAILEAFLIGPLIGRDALHLLDFGDYPENPHPPFTPSAFGFPPGITSRAPVDAVLYWAFQAVHWAPVRLLPFAAVAPLAWAGFARLFPGRPLATGAAVLLFTVNPFVYERMASGQVYVVMGYSLLPVLLALLIRPLASLTATAVAGGLVYALSAAVSVHYLFIAGLMIAVVVLAHLAGLQARPALAGAGTAFCGLVLSLYWLIPAAQALRTMPSHVTRMDLSVFQTVGDQVWGLGVNIAGLYGFWRPGPPLVQDYLSGWPFLLLVIVMIAAAGIRALAGAGLPAGRALALSCVVLAVTGGLLAAGAQGPTGALYTWLFGHLPGFKVMREAEKFSALVALAYAASFGPGAEAVSRSLTQDLSRKLCAAGACAVVLVYGWTELWGFDGYARPTAYPASWAAADRAMSPGATALALPWRSYLPVPWMGNRVVPNPVQGYFDRPVISADDLEAGPIETESSNPRSLFLQYGLSEAGRLTEFGRVLAPLGIRFVILARVPGEQDLAWLGRQRDLTRVFSSATIAVYRNDEAVPASYAPARRLVLRDWGQVLALAQRVPLTDCLIQVRHAAPGPLALPPGQAIPPPKPPMVLAAPHGSAVSLAVRLPQAASTVVLPNPAYPGWQLAGFRATPQFGVTVAFRGPAGLRHPAVLVAGYTPWRLVERCDLAGACLTAGSLTLLAISLTRRRRSRPT